MQWHRLQVMIRRESFMREVARNQLDKPPRPCDVSVVVHAGSCWRPEGSEFLLRAFALFGGLSRLLHPQRKLREFSAEEGVSTALAAGKSEIYGKGCALTRG